MPRARYRSAVTRIADLKAQRIKDIRAAGLDVGHVIHRHGIESEELAFQIEAAVMDAYPGLTNQTGGHRSGDYGVRHAREIIAEYSAEPFDIGEMLILISIGKSYDEAEKSIYEAVRGVWVIVRWSLFVGQVVKLGSPMKDGPDNGQAEAVFG